MSVTCYAGLWGHGKTLALARHGLEALKQGKEVWSNFGLYGSRHFTDLDEMITVVAHSSERTPRTLLVDELPMLLPADGPCEFTPSMRLLWFQGRKLGLDVAYTAQDFDTVQRKVRAVTGTVVSCRGYLWRYVAEVDDKAPRVYGQAHYLAAKWGKAKADPYRRRIRTFDREAAASYDTYALIESAQALLRDELKRARKRPHVEVHADMLAQTG